MPKRNTARPVGPEADVATRIYLERTRRRMSAAELSRQMAAAGCPINQSAINKIEQGDPPRSISTNELVAFAQVFGLEVEDLLLPPYAARERRIADLYKRMAQLNLGISGASQVFITMAAELAEVAGLDGNMTQAAQAALDELDRAFKRLHDALAGVSEGVRQGLNAPMPEAKPPTSGLTFRERRSYEKRAAEAAAQLPPDATSPRTPQRRKTTPRRGSTEDGKHPEAP